MEKVDLTNKPIIRYDHLNDMEVITIGSGYQPCGGYEIRSDIFEKFINWAKEENKKNGFELQ